MNLSDIIFNGIVYFLSSFFDEFISFFSTILADVMSTSMEVLRLPLVQNGIAYTQALAFTLLVLKVANEAFQTYILYQNGDPDANPAGLVVRTGQSVAVIAALPWIVQEIFTLGTKVTSDVAGLSTGQTGIEDWTFITTTIVASGGMIVLIFGILLAVIFIVVAIQATIRGAELALMAILGPIIALRLSSANRDTWNQWFSRVIVICCSQALQIFMLSGALALLTSQVVTNNGLLLVFGWLWVTVKTPKYVQQFAYSTGFSGAVGGTAKQAGSMYVMRKIMSKGA